MSRERGNIELLDVDKQAYTQTHDEISTPAIGPVPLLNMPSISIRPG